MKKNLVFLIILFFSLVSIFSNGNSEISENMNNNQSEKVLHLAGGNVGTLNPFQHMRRGPGIFRTFLIYDTLLERDEDGLIPWLASAWDISEDGQTYTFYLQQEAKWHDGIDLTANDVQFSIEYYKKHPPVYDTLIVNGKFIIDDVKVINEKTVQIHTISASVSYLEHLGYLKIIPKHIWENVDNPKNYQGFDNCVGSGPFIVESYDSALGTYRLVANKDYWGLKQAVDVIEWIPVSDNILAFENGEIDLTTISPDLINRYDDNKEYTLSQVAALHSYRLMMNMEKRVELQDKNLRKAIAYAIDVQELIDKIDRGVAFKSSAGYIPNFSSYYNEDVVKYDYNKQKALELLDGKEYSFTLLTDNSSESMKMCELIKLKLEDVNIHVTIKAIDSVSRDDAIVKGDYELVLVFYGNMGGDPDYLRDIYTKKSNYLKGWSNNELEGILEQQSVEFDLEKRTALLDRAQYIISDEVPMYLMQGALWTFVYRPEVYDNWMCRYDHNYYEHNKLSYLIR
ncbi:MAG: ABC transporter substrate-binding protein [Pleomorphochaeta sp.]